MWLTWIQSLVLHKLSILPRPSRSDPWELSKPRASLGVVPPPHTHKPQENNLITTHFLKMCKSLKCHSVPGAKGAAGVQKQMKEMTLLLSNTFGVRKTLAKKAGKWRKESQRSWKPWVCLAQTALRWEHQAPFHQEQPWGPPQHWWEGWETPDLKPKLQSLRKFLWNSSICAAIIYDRDEIPKLFQKFILKNAHDKNSAEGISVTLNLSLYDALSRIRCLSPGNT